MRGDANLNISGIFESRVVSRNCVERRSSRFLSVSRPNCCFEYANAYFEDIEMWKNIDGKTGANLPSFLVSDEMKIINYQSKVDIVVVKETKGVTVEDLEWEVSA